VKGFGKHADAILAASPHTTEAEAVKSGKHPAASSAHKLRHYAYRELP